MKNTTIQQTLNPIFNLLKYTFVLIPIVAGADKFTNLLTNWEQYIHPNLAAMLPFSPGIFMKIVGIIEIIAGCIVFRKPEIGGLIVAAWLTAIALSLLLSGMFIDVAVRDLVMAIAAYSLAKIAKLENA